MRQDSIKGLEVILNTNNEYLTSSSEEKTETCDKCNWIITRVFQGMSKRDKESSDKYYVNISSAELKKYLGTRDYKSILSLLIETRILKPNDKYSSGKFSKSYCLTNYAFERGVVNVEVSSESFKKRLHQIAEKDFEESTKDPLLEKIIDNTAKLIVVEQDSYYKDKLLELTEEEMDNDIPKFSIIGQPNVGKSSLTNALLGKERNIVTDIAGTTRDAIHERFTKFDKDFYIIDTAGIRKKSKVHEDLEFYSVMRAVKAIEESDVCILMVDATQGLTSQDLNLLRLVEKRKKGLVLAVNKWDLVEKDTNTARDMEKNLREKIGMFTDIPIIFVSALEKQRILKVMELALEVEENRRRRIKTSVLNEIMLEAIERVPPPAYRGRFITIKYVVQLPVHYPAFAFFCNNPKYVKDAYKAYLENQLRKNFNFTGVPVTIFFREK